jgi:hypothetical protein
MPEPNEKKPRTNPDIVKEEISTMDLPAKTKEKACAEVDQMAAAEQSGGKMTQNWDNVAYAQHSHVGIGGKLPQHINDVNQEWKGVKPAEDNNSRVVADGTSRLGIHFEG